MLNDLLPLGLTGAARRLGVDPFGLVRLLVATDGMPANLLFTDAQIDALRERGDIQDSWWTGVDLPEDTNPLRQRVRGALGLLLGRGYVGGDGTRLDNVWRGLPREDQALVRNALLALVDEGHLLVVSTRVASNVTINPSSEDRIRGIVDGTADSSALSALYEG